MDAIKFLESKILELPKKWDQKNDFEIFLADLFDSYKKFLGDLKPSDSITRNIKSEADRISNISSKVQECINYYLEGFPHKAHKALTEAITEAGSYFNKLLVETDEPLNLGDMYRIRIGTEMKYSLEKMFHIPFQERFKVGSQRYSIPGLPCLYLSNTLYAAWSEMGRPDFNQMQIVRLKPIGDSIKILDFGMRPTAWCEEPSYIKTFEERIIAEAIVWPIIAACSLTTDGRDRKFKHEYIIPQLVLQWLRDTEKYDGVRYFSMNMIENDVPLRLMRNFAFPVQEKSAHGQCPILKSYFEMTTPTSWQILSTGKLSSYSLEGAQEDLIDLIESHSIAYRDTIFGEIQIKLANMPLHKL